MNQDDLVRASYDSIAKRYTAQRDQFKSLVYLDRFVALLPAGSRVLDLGCGAGLPVDRYLMDSGLRVHGIDISERQIELARTNNSEATYEVANMRELKERAYTVDGVVSFYAVFHTPREEHARLFHTLRTYLGPGGPLLVTMGASDWEGVEDGFHGAKMYWSHYAPPQNREIVEMAGFEVLWDEIDESGDERHQVILARAC